MTETIALVDDDRNILTSISIALEKEGFNVQTYLDGESAYIGITRTPPDLAVIDVKMPKMDGEELLRKLRKKTSLPVILLTSKDEEVDELLGLKLGADDFIKKSGGFSIKVLIERIRVQLRKKDNANIPYPTLSPDSAFSACSFRSSAIFLFFAIQTIIVPSIAAARIITIPSNNFADLPSKPSANIWKSMDPNILATIAAVTPCQSHLMAPYCSVLLR